MSVKHRRGGRDRSACGNGSPVPVAGRVRWLVCGLLFAAGALSYIDRQVLSVLKPTLQAKYAWSETGYADIAFWFQAAYGLSYIAFGRIVDRFGARAGYALAVSLWTIGHVACAFVTSTAGFTLARIPLAVGESGSFPSALAAVADWFPRRERTLAIGVLTASSNVGAILAPLIVRRDVTLALDGARGLRHHRPVDGRLAGCLAPLLSPAARAPVGIEHRA